MNSHEREMAPGLAAIAVRGYFRKFRGTADQFGSIRDSREALNEICHYLGEVDTWGSEPKQVFFYHLLEGCPEGVNFEEEHGDLAFEILVQLALAYRAFGVTARVLDFTRRHAAAIPGLSSIAGITLARAVTSVCRERYRPHVKPPKIEPPEKVALPLSRRRAGEVALRYLRWVANGPVEKDDSPVGFKRIVAESDLPRKMCSSLDIEKVVAGEDTLSRDVLSKLLHDLQEDADVVPPRGRYGKLRAWAAYRRNCHAALAVAIHDFASEGFTVEDVVLERAWMLAGEIEISLEDAFGFLRRIATHSRGR